MALSIGGIGTQGIGGIGERRGIPVEGLTRTRGGESFADTLKRALGDVQQLQDDAQEIIARFVRGEHVDLHAVMAATEEAGIALELLIEIRNKLTEAYRTVVSMQA